MKDYDEDKESSYLKYWDVKKFKWVENVVKASSK